MDHPAVLCHCPSVRPLCSAWLLLLQLLLIGSTAVGVRRRPCTPTITEDCDAGRFVPCGHTAGGLSLAASLVRPDKAASCRDGPGQVHPREMILIQFTNGPPEDGSQCMEILVHVGECWGQDSDGGNYDCLGLCGVGCQPEWPGLCSNWSRNCLRHDVCSYYYNSRGGALDSSCGYLFNWASPDYVVPCLTDHRCELSNFSTAQQVCQPHAAERIHALGGAQGHVVLM